MYSGIKCQTSSSHLLLCTCPFPSVPVRSEAPPGPPQNIRVDNWLLSWTPATKEEDVTYTVQYSRWALMVMAPVATCESITCMKKNLKGSCCLVIWQEIVASSFPLYVCLDGVCVCGDSSQTVFLASKKLYFHFNLSVSKCVTHCKYGYWHHDRFWTWQSPVLVHSFDSRVWTDVPACIHISSDSCDVSSTKALGEHGCVMLRVQAEKKRGLTSKPVKACSRHGRKLWANMYISLITMCSYWQQFSLCCSLHKKLWMYACVDAVVLSKCSTKETLRLLQLWKSSMLPSCEWSEWLILQTNTGNLWFQSLTR